MGRKDGINPFAMSARFAQGIKGAELVAFDRSSHVPDQEEPDAFDTALERFLDER